MKKKGYLLPVLLVLLTIWLLFCTHLAGLIPVKEVFSSIAIPIIVFMVSAACLVRFGRKGRLVLSILLYAFTLFECVIGILQLFNLYPSNDTIFILTGHFTNQGLYGALMSLTCVSCLYEFIVSKNKKLKFTLAAIFLFSFTMMLLSVSRAAWLGFVIAAVAIVRRETNLKINLSRKLYLATAIILTVIICAGVFLIKPKSALARVHIWRIDCLTIIEHPLFGSGSIAEMGAYGDAQEHFFSKKERANIVKQLASCPKYAFNEFLKFGMQGGILALVLALSIYFLSVVRLFKKKSEYAYLLIALGVFSLFSFPLFSFIFCIILAILLADASVSDGFGILCWSILSFIIVICAIPEAIHRINVMLTRKEWLSEPRITMHFEKYYPDLKYDPDFIYLYGYTLYSKGDYEQAIEILTEGSKFSSVSQYHCLIGRCKEYLGDFPSAQKAYKKAMNMIPTRLVPYYMMILHYKALGFGHLAKKYQNIALSIPIDTTQSGTVTVRKLIEDVELGNASPDQINFLISE